MRKAGHSFGSTEEGRQKNREPGILWNFDERYYALNAQTRIRSRFSMHRSQGRLFRRRSRGSPRSHRENFPDASKSINGGCLYRGTGVKRFPRVARSSLVIEGEYMTIKPDLWWLPPGTR